MADSLVDLSHSSYHTLKRPIRRVALACIQCRSRKVKCDATLPTCIRCSADGKTCDYQKSRRGGRPRRLATVPSQLAVERPSTSVENESTEHWDDLSGVMTDRHSSSHQSSGSGSGGSSTQSVVDTLESVSYLDSITLPGAFLSQTQMVQLLTQYFTSFHVSHPCVLPRWSLNMRLASDPIASETLLPVLLYIGSIYTYTVDSAPLAVTARQAIDTTRLTPGLPSPFYVQALLLYAIAVYASNEPERGRELLDEAIRGALSLGMHRSGFASQHGQMDPVLEESWRRTWWSIYITDAHIAGSGHSFPTQTGAAQITADLPCEELQYESGNIPPPASLRSYGVREFSDIEFSSFAQLIGFTQGINRALATRRMGDIENAKITAQNADTAMTAWCSLLPASKRRILRDDGSVDELLFKANILMHTYIVDIHRQLSTLKYFPIETISKCVPPPPPESNNAIKDEAHIHTAKVLFAANKLNGLLTLPTRFTEHTPFIICMITLTTIAELSACRYIFKEPKLSLEREKIRLNMGVLKMMGEVWLSGKREYDAVGKIAREILSIDNDEIQIPETTPVMPIDAMDFNFNFDVDWGC
ncbi:putative C6 transcription factor, partial [Ophiobolus disseminans]